MGWGLGTWRPGIIGSVGLLSPNCFSFLKFCISPFACGIGVPNPLGIISVNMSALRVAYESYYLTVNHYGQYRREEKITYN